MKNSSASSCMHVICLALMLCAGLSGCVLNAQSPATQWYVLPSPEQAPVHNSQLTGPKIALGPLTLPGYLDRSSIFVRQDPQTPNVHIMAAARWSEPLDEGCLRVLSDSLGTALSDIQAVVFPYRFALPTDWRLFINITRFDGAPGSDVVLSADWSLLTARGVIHRSGHFSETIKAGSDIDGLVSAQGKLMNRFGTALAQELRRSLTTK